MKKVAILLAGLLLSAGITDTFAKKDKSLPLKEVKQGVTISNNSVPSQFPKYPGGAHALISYFGEGSFVPKGVSNTFEGNLKLKLSFDIAQDGTTQNVRVVALDRSELDKADQEVIRRVQRSVAGLRNWAPAMQNGTAVAAEFSMTLVVNNDSQDPLYNGGLGFVSGIRPAGIVR